MHYLNLAPRSPSAPRILLASGGAGRLALAAALLLHAAATALPSGAHAQAELNDGERGRLRNGQLVTRPARQRHGGQITFGGTSYQVVNAPVSQVWNVLQDTGRYVNILPQVESVRQIASSGSQRTLTIHHHHGPVDVTYSMRFTFDANSRTVLFQLDENRPHDIRAGWGFIRLSARSGNRTLVSFGAMVGVDSGVISGALRPRLHEWLLKVPLTMKWYLDRQRRAS
jgi:hypothetical protein